MEINEIVFLGRGGQGGKTASLILANALIALGFEVQAFSEYGPERSGAPVNSFLRYSRSKIFTNSQIKNPDYLVVLDDSLLGLKDVAQYLNNNLKILINSSSDCQTIKGKFQYLKNYSYFIFDCDKIANEIYKKPIVNICILAFLIKHLNLKNDLQIIKILEGFKDPELNIKAYKKTIKNISL